MLEQRYRIGRLLGEGGMAAVYLAEDTKLGKPVAIKLLKAEYAAQPKVVQRFMQEARAISMVNHPNVVDVTDHGVTPDRSVFLVMELLSGEDLSALLEREGPLPWPRLGPMVMQVCAALATVHARGIVHRDVKPSNCFRVRVAGYPDFIKVLDFGIAKFLGDAAIPGAPRSTTGSLLGTPEYMAPELPQGLAPDERVDVYALGAMIYKLLTGVAPFSGETYMAVLAAHMFETPVPPSVRAPGQDISPEVDAVILRALAKDREARFASMAEMAEALASTLPGAPSAALWLAPTATPAVRPEPRPPEPRRPPEPLPAEPRSDTSMAYADTTPRRIERPRRRPWLRTALLAGAAVVVLLLALGPHINLWGEAGGFDPDLVEQRLRTTLGPRLCGCAPGGGAFDLKISVPASGAGAEARPGASPPTPQVLACAGRVLRGARLPSSDAGGVLDFSCPL
jgi:serine/threonine protein kinase